jgi:hypothetical protein
MSINLTRRSLFARTAAIAVVAAAPAALAKQQPPVVEAPAPIGPTRIDQLWKERQATIREYDRLQKLLRKLEAEVERKMPAPHPSIVYGPEQDKDGLQPRVPRLAEIDKFIWPLYIESRLSAVNAAALRNRLVARLKLSKQYQRLLRRVQDKVGRTALVDKMEKVTDRQTAIESRIASAKPVTRGDMARNLALYDHYKREFYGEEIIRNLRKLFAGEITLAA